MIDTVYFDNFANEYVLSTDNIAPPERYMTVRRGHDKRFTERWHLENGRTVNIVFDEDSYRQNARHYREQEELKERSTLSRMYCWEVPDSTFNQILKEMGIK